MSADPRDALSLVLRQLLQAHDALVANVTPATLDAYERAIDEARVAHAPLEQRAVERAGRVRR